MDRIKGFFLDERGDAYITSIVVCTAVIATVLAAVYLAYFEGGIATFFNTLQTKFAGWATNVPDLPTQTAT